ncbi:hypothetical protein INT47_010654 [Mucor saturninus]|uniref:Zinc finger PHD-type domain-containing protein n=1 Tax=Mucor saturninus TaxID=64648 RepID=A0A8H7QLK2_9FUNG|nr:hypothetical protein INT47_010654 [Mucor saturninus]
MRTKSHTKHTKRLFSPIDNQITRNFQSIQPSKVHCPSKENGRNRHAFVTCAYDHPQTPSHATLPKTFKHVPQTFTTDITHNRALPTQRPTMGGKSISAIRPTQQQHPIMSSHDLLLLSRRIDPQELLTSSPHTSPCKPPLPQQQQQQEEPQSKKRPPKMTKQSDRGDDVVQFVCEPCNKRYKTRNGYSYHIERCKSRRQRLHRQPIEGPPVTIQCVCSESGLEKGTMIECNTCHTWLHLQCVGPIVDESSFACTRCCPQDSNVRLSEMMLCAARDQDFNFMQLLGQKEDVLSNTQWEDEFTQQPTSTASFLQESCCWTTPMADPPSLLFSDNLSLLDDFPSSELLSPSLPQSDWLHFANFEVDFQREDEPP